MSVVVASSLSRELGDSRCVAAKASSSMPVMGEMDTAPVAVETDIDWE